jgi:hypothetical protein
MPLGANRDLSLTFSPGSHPRRTHPSIFVEDMSPSAISNISPTNSFLSVDPFYENPKNSYLETHNHGGVYHGVNDPKKLIGKALKERVESIDQDVCEAGEEDTFFVADLGEVYRQHMRWKKNLPRVKPFYGKFLSIVLYVGCELISGQRSSATPTHKLSGFWQHSVLASIAPQRRRSNRS